MREITELLVINQKLVNSHNSVFNMVASPQHARVQREITELLVINQKLVNCFC